MAQTKEGGLKAAETNKRLYGDDFYRKMGQKGGKIGRTGGFYNNPELASIAGAKGGKISKRGPAKAKPTQTHHVWDIFKRGKASAN